MTSNCDILLFLRLGGNVMSNVIVDQFTYTLYMYNIYILLHSTNTYPVGYKCYNYNTNNK